MRKMIDLGIVVFHTLSFLQWALFIESPDVQVKLLVILFWFETPVYGVAVMAFRRCYKQGLSMGPLLLNRPVNRHRIVVYY